MSTGDCGQLELFRERLPWHGYATDELSAGLRFFARDHAILRAYLQYNPRHSIGWLVYDMDSDTAILDWDDRQCPAPNIIALNRSNGHAHIFYAIERPIYDYLGASQKALRYVASIDIALTRKLGADPGYAKLISKNPLHARWYVTTPRADPYDLDELADWLDLDAYQDRRRRLPTEGLGRNCTLFETLRIWAYRARRQPYLSESMFHESVRNHALVINSAFSPPLPNSEIRATAKSIAKWTWRHMSPEAFSAYQRRVGHLGNVEKRIRMRERYYLIQQTAMQCPDLTQDEIAALCQVSRRTVCRALKDEKQFLI